MYLNRLNLVLIKNKIKRLILLKLKKELQYHGFCKDIQNVFNRAELIGIIKKIL